MAKKIVVVGSLNMDLVAGVVRMPQPGETVSGQTFATHPGGKGANQAVAAARLGANVAMVGRLGADAFGTQLRTAMASDGIDLAAVEDVDGFPTGCAVILVDAEGMNSITVIPGANGQLKASDLSEETFADAGIVLCQLEVPLETVCRAAEIASEMKIPFMLDPAPARTLPSTLLSHVTWLTPNESEAPALLRDLGGESIQGVSQDNVPQIAERLLATGARNVVVKMGAQGVYAAGEDLKPIFVESFSVAAVDSTAAGDAFNGAFAYALMQGKDVSGAVRFACASAAVSVTRAGAQRSMPVLDEVEALLAAKA